MGPNVCEVGILTQVVDGPIEGIEEGERRWMNFQQ
jgi:hypothetical protein